MPHPVIEFLLSVAVIGVAVATIAVALRRRPGVVSSHKRDQPTCRHSGKFVTAALLIVASCFALLAVGLRCTTYLALGRDPGRSAIHVLNTASLIVFGIAASAPKAAALLRAHKLVNTNLGQTSVAVGLTLAVAAAASNVAAGVLLAVPGIPAGLPRNILFLSLSSLLATLMMVRVSDCLVGLGQFGYWRTSVLSAVDAKITICCIFALALDGLGRTFFALTNVGIVWNALALAWETDAQEEVDHVRSLRIRASAESFGGVAPQVQTRQLEEGHSEAPMYEKRTSFTSTLSVVPLVKADSELNGFPVSIHSGDYAYDGEDSQHGGDLSLSELARHADEEMDQVSSTLAPASSVNKDERQSVASKHSMKVHEQKGARESRASRASYRLSESSRYSEELTYYEPNPTNLPPPIYLARHKRLTATGPSIANPPAGQEYGSQSHVGPRTSSATTNSTPNYSRPSRSQS